MWYNYRPVEGSVLHDVSHWRFQTAVKEPVSTEQVLTKIRLVGAALQPHSFLCALNQEVAH